MPQPITYVRVKDTRTGHEIDVPDSHPRIGSTLKRVKDDRYPPSPVARRPKFAAVIPKPAATRSRQSVPSSDAPDSTAEKE
jgi:hypothetical protein